ncbi:MAG: NosD domain-containing protein [Candidatus Thorarchaeota archaeon]
MTTSKFKISTSILILFILTMSFSFTITPLVITEVSSGNIAVEQASERFVSQESFDVPRIREVDSPEREAYFSHDFDYPIVDSKGWDVEQPEREPYQSESMILSPGTPHATIVIDSNDDFDTQGWPGDGSPGTPFLIHDLEINATAANPGISITGTDVYFVISDCIINGSYQSSTGIVLNAVANALIYNNTCFEGGIGILLNQTDGISVIENQCFSMDSAGIYLDGSDGNTIQRNFVTDCWDGIYLERSNLNYVDENFCAGNMWGIDLYWTSNENDVYNNTVIYNTANGIILILECTLNTIELNDLEGNGDFGIYLEDSDGNTIRENYSELDYGGIVLLDTVGNVLDNNTIEVTNGPEGLVLLNTNDTLVTNNFLFEIEYAMVAVECSGIDFIDNNCTYFDYGLILEACDDILVEDCYFDSFDNSYCVYALGSTNLDIIDSYFYQTETLLWIEGCDTVNIIGNDCFNYMGAILNLGTNSSTIKDNVMEMGGAIGIVSDTTYDTVIHNNTVVDHETDFGIGVFESPDAIVTSNNCTVNLYALVVEDCEGILIEDNICNDYTTGIDVVTSNHSRIVGNHVEEGDTGINVVNSFFVDILDNDVIDNVEGPTGIHLTDCGSCLISGNNLTGNVVPSIHVETSHHCNVTYNVITETIDGIVLDSSNYTIITDNHITMGQGYGIGVWGSSHNFVSRNHIANISGWEGWALCSNDYDNEFTYNLCDNSTVGLYIDGFGPFIAHNTAHGNDEAIWLLSSCANATVSWNVFEDNVHNGLDDSMTSIFDYNYWSNYTGVDADSDGIGDTWHPIEGMANNNDTHPLVYYPTVPTWLVEPVDQDHEYGHDFEYTLEVVAPSEIAPIADWWIDDADFAVADGVITNNVALDFGEHPVEVRVINIYGFYLSGHFIVTVNDTVAPTIVGPDDFSYVVGQSISWTADDYDPASYSVTLDGVEIMSGAWNSTAENITISLDGLSVGDYTYVVTFTDGSGNSATDTVVVTVLAGGDTTLILIIVGAGGAIVAVVIIIYLMKKKGAGT